MPGPDALVQFGFDMKTPLRATLNQDQSAPAIERRDGAPRRSNGCGKLGDRGLNRLGSNDHGLELLKSVVTEATVALQKPNRQGLPLDFGDNDTKTITPPIKVMSGHYTRSVQPGAFKDVRLQNCCHLLFRRKFAEMDFFSHLSAPFSSAGLLCL